MTRSFAVRTTCIGLPTGFHAPFLPVSRLFLFEYMQRQLDAVTTTFHRYIYPNISWDNRMLGIVGPRGVGKTTLFLQRIKEMGSPQTTLYVSADHMYFADHTLFDTADAFVKNGGTHLLLTSERKFGRRIALSSSEPKPSSLRALPSLSRRNPSHASCT